MSMEISFELSDSDLEHFWRVMVSAREKVADWFRSRSAELNEAEGRLILLNALERLQLVAPGKRLLAQASALLGFATDSACFCALGSGDC